MDKFDKIQKDIELSIENPEKYKKEKAEEIINTHKYPINDMANKITTNDNTPFDKYIETLDDTELPDDDGIEIVPLTEAQKAIIGQKASKIYEMAIKIKDNKDISDKDILSVAQNGIINSKDYKRIKLLDDKERSKYIAELKDIIMDFAYQLAFDIQMKENGEFGDTYVNSMSEYYFSQYDEMFGYNPNTDTITEMENVSSELQKTYYDSLHLDNILQFMKTKDFLKGLHKNVSKKMDWVISFANRCINAQVPSHSGAQFSRNILNSMISFKKIFPDLNDKQAKSFIVAMSLFSRKNKDINKYCGAYLLMINMNLFALSLILTGKTPVIEGTAKIFYENLIRVKEEIQKIKVLK